MLLSCLFRPKNIKKEKMRRKEIKNRVNCKVGRNKGFFFFNLENPKAFSCQKTFKIVNFNASNKNFKHFLFAYPIVGSWNKQA